MAAKRKASTKQNLEEKIAELEAKLTKLSSQLEAKPAETKPAEVKPAERPAATTKPKGTLPKGFDTPAEAPKPQDAPKPAETTSQPPATVQAALEDAYYTAPMTSFHDYRAKVTGYSPAPNRYFVRRTAPVGKVPTTNWNDQKATVTGYTQPSNQYFATRARIAHHPADKTFGGFSGTNLSVEGIVEQAQVQQTPPPPEPPKPAKDTLPKGMEQTQQSNYDSNEGKSKKQQLEDYENDYLQRIEQKKLNKKKPTKKLLKMRQNLDLNKHVAAYQKGLNQNPTLNRQNLLEAHSQKVSNLSTTIFSFTF